MGTAWEARHGLSGQQYQSEFNRLDGLSYRLTEVNGYVINGQDQYAAIWEQTGGPAWQARHGLTGDQYQAAFNDLTSHGFRPVKVSGYSGGGEPHYAAIFVQSPGPAWVARHGLTGDQYQAEFNNLTRQGYRLVDVSGYCVNNAPHFAAVFEKSAGPAWQARHNLTSDQYQATFNQLTGQGYRPVRVSAYTVGGQDLYAAIFVMASSPAWIARHRLDGRGYQNEFDNQVYQGYRLKDVCGYEINGRPRFAAIWDLENMNSRDLQLIDQRIGAYMSANDVPGLSLAITKNERLVYAKGFGYADKVAQETVSPRYRFRIASVSKPVTAIAVMDLIEAGRLGLDDKVFGQSARLGTTYGTKPYNNDVKNITVRHLLQHTSGWTNDGGDPMFMNPGMSHSQLIGWVLDNRAPKTTPGTSSTYLNFGYCVLGRVIEKVTGQSYEDHLRFGILQQAGISKMTLAGDTLAARQADEVVYYGGNCYGMPVHRMDAHGGWIATPIDLLRLMVRADGWGAKTDILTGSTESTMWTGNTASPGYGLGWIVDANYRGHNGAFDGSISFLVRRNDGFSFAVIANTRPSGDTFAFNLKGVVDGIINDVSGWPGYDLF